MVMVNLEPLVFLNMTVMIEESCMKSRNKLILILICILLSVSAIVLVVDNYISNYCNTLGRNSKYLSTAGYAAALRVDRFDVESFTKVYGEPIAVQQWLDPENPGRELVLHTYPSFDILYLVDTSSHGEKSLRFLQIKIKDETIRIGGLKIGVGSQRNIIRLAFLLDPKMSKQEIEYSSYDFPEADEGFYGEDWWRILLDYNDEGNVVSMAYTISPN